MILRLIHYKNIFKIFISTLLLIISITGFSQKVNKIRTKADNKFFEGEYYVASQIYRKVYKKTKNKSDKAEINYLIADCYRYARDVKQAENFYKKAMKMNDKDPLVVLNHANMLRILGDYEASSKEYSNYLILVPGALKGLQGFEACSLAVEWTNNPTRYIVEEMGSLNSKLNDFSPTYDSRKDYNSIYFTSNRDKTTGKKISGIIGDRFTDIFEVQKDRKGKWSEPTPLDTLVNSEYDEGTPALNSKANEMLFTKCKIEKKNKHGCQIYKSAKQGADWGECESLQIVGDSVSIGHPSISADEKTLYFASRELGGSGGADLFKVTRDGKSGKWTVPINLGDSINSPSDELYPFIRDDGILYFSSDREISMGGLDIYKAYVDEDSVLKVENMKYPINSNADDFGIIFQGSNEKGLFSSARKGGRGGIDIYSFYIPPLEFSVTGIIKDEDTGEPIEGVVVKLVGSDGTIFRDTTKAEVGFTFKLKPKTDYLYIASKLGYFNGKGSVTTNLLDRSQVLKTEATLSSIAKTIELPNIEYDFAKWDLRESSKSSLDILVTTLNDNPSLTVELMSHSDMIGNDSINLVVSQRRAQSVVDYIISKGIESERLVAKGYGKTQPKVADKSISTKYPFIPEKTVLGDDFINTLTDSSQKDICNQFNRRTEFKVLSTTYVPSKSKKTNNP
ncbi:MAG: hypothetical protein A2033_00310 [Bacteroidetes bacterium GWA2_31_9]|nr:MAG: hypothetical protein A2033_00310 [Bacteroidetes bacterium GWA2_31_9]